MERKWGKARGVDGFTSRQPGLGLVHHSDRSTQYASNEYVRRLEEAQMLISMSRPARPWENGVIVSFQRDGRQRRDRCRGKRVSAGNESGYHECHLPEDEALIRPAQQRH